jgi:hypothetical protein
VAGKRVIEVELVSDSSKFRSGMDQAEKKSGGFGGALAKVGKMAAVGLAGGLTVAVGAGKKFIEAAEESRKVSQQTEAVIKSTGGAAGVTAKQVGDLAGSISKKTGVDDEAIQSGQNMLLTFKNLKDEAGKGNDIFTQSTKIMTDMSVALGQDATQSAMQLGKALNDPVKGVGALSRVGVTFTEEQKKSIKTMVEHGNVAGAQKVILKELAGEFGGSAEAQASASDKAKVAFGNLQEAIGNQLLGAYDKVMTFAGKFIEQLQSGHGAGARLKDVALDLANAIKNLATFLWNAKEAIGAVAAVLVVGKGAALAWSAGVTVASFVTGGWATTFWALNAAMRANPLGFVATVLAVVAGALVYAWTNSETFRTVVTGAFTVVATIATSLWGVIKAVFGGIVSAISGAWRAISGAAGPAWETIRTVLTGYWNAISGAASGAWNAIKNYIVNPIVSAAKAVANAAGDIVRWLGDAWGTVKGAANTAWNAIERAIVNPMGDALRGIQSKVNSIKEWLGNAWGDVKDTISRVGNGIVNAMTAPFERAWNSISSVVSRIKGAVSSIASLPGKALKAVIPGYAAGTNYASGGIKLVGEHGPELIYSRGGESIKTASETRQIMSGGGSSGVNITIHGNVGSMRSARVLAADVTNRMRF